MTNLDRVLWPEAHCAQLIGALTRLPGGGDASDPESACAALGIECQEATLTPANAAAQLASLAPGLVRIPGRGWLGVLSRSGRSLVLLAPNLGRVKIPIDQIRRVLCQPFESFVRPEIEALVQACGIAGRRRERAIQALSEERTRAAKAGSAWELRLPPGAAFTRQIRQAGLLKRVAIFIAAHVAELLLLLASWWAVGQGALSGRLDTGWLAAWAALLICTIPLRMLTTWSQGLLAVGVGGLLKQRLLAGALRLDPDLVKRQGAGELLGRVVESESLETLALGGGLATLLAAFELLIAGAVMLFGAAPLLQTAVFALWVALIAWMSLGYYRRRRQWSRLRLEMTHSTVERMTGHRTRLAQERPERWHSGEDEQMDAYFIASADLDASGARLAALAPRGWLIAGIAAIAPYFLSAAVDPAPLAISLGAILLAHEALKRMSAGLAQLAGAAIAWEQIAPMFRAAGEGPASEPVVLSAPHSKGETVLDAHELAYRYPGQSEAVLRHCTVRISRGDRLLLEGPSGGGKSTFTALLSGLRTPDSGLLLAGGLDRATLGDAGWRTRVTAAPQYHENHILSAPLAFNLLLGKPWPPGESDMKEAHAVCRELGLGPLLDRMPGGLQQFVGETGWQLSQGERSRVFLARALLQDAEVVILDESFAALDPENLKQCLECVFRRAKTLLVVAHP